MGTVPVQSFNYRKTESGGKMKKTILFFLVCVCVFFLCACQREDEKAEPTGTSATEEDTVTEQTTVLPEEPATTMTAPAGECPFWGETERVPLE